MTETRPACRPTVRSAFCGGLVRCFDLMGVMRLSPDSKVVVDDYLAAYGSEQYGAELARRGRVLTWGLNLAFLWVLAMVGSGFGLVLAGWQVVGVTLAVTPMVLAMVLVVRLRIEQRAGRGPSGWG